MSGNALNTGRTGAGNQDRNRTGSKVKLVRLAGLAVAALGLASGISEVIRGHSRQGIYFILTALLLALLASSTRRHATAHLHRHGLAIAAHPRNRSTAGGLLILAALTIGSVLFVAGLIALFLGRIAWLAFIIPGVGMAAIGIRGLAARRPETSLERTSLAGIPPPWLGIAGLLAAFALGAVLAAAIAAEWLQRGGNWTILAVFAGLGGAFMAWLAIIGGTAGVLVWRADRPAHR